VQFQRLRLSGFKSFVDPTEFRIEPGLTAIVGPNGCGKSNLLEALRWVMGANSAKAMRGDGMDDVIFAGSGGRPSRNHAEVALTIDNSDHTAPAAFNSDSVLEVVRRIDRGQGSTYRINGREVRARDVQLLFADASTGANSPALVRQGQISELIAAKPQNRRRILEEAGGVAGLHTRRHEAELRLRAAEANLLRLEDVMRELETTVARLKREARQAERYTTISAEIRRLQSAVLYARWTDARDAVLRTEAEASAAEAQVVKSTREASAAIVRAEQTEEAIRPLREEEQVTSAVLHRLAIEKDRVEGEAQRAEAEIARLVEERRRLEQAREREAHIVDDAAAAVARLNAELAELQAKADDAPSRLPILEAIWKEADAARARADTQLEELAAKVAADEARRRAAESRIEEARARVGRTIRALDMAKADRAALGPEVDPAAARAKAAFDEALAAFNAARAAAEAAEIERASAITEEAAVRAEARRLEDQLGKLRSEARGLAQIAAQPMRGGFAPALDKVSPYKGYEAALAAALGDDLDAALDAKAPAFWGGRDAVGQAWPRGVEPLADKVAAPPQLAARLAMVGLVDRAEGERLAKTLPTGARLVSREGDLWRWDGYVSRAEAPRPAAIRMAQRTRLAEAEAEIVRMAPAAEASDAAQKAATQRLAAAETAVRDARRGVQEADRAVGPAREAVERIARDAARRDARAQSLDETIARFDAERIETETVLATAIAEGEDPAGAVDLTPVLSEARQKALAAREAAASARADMDQEGRERDQRSRRLEQLGRDQSDWMRRAETARRHIETLAEDHTKVDAALKHAREAPTAINERRLKLLDEFAAAEARRAKAADALGTAEAARAEADRESRAAEAAASQAREARAGLAARLDAARERIVEITANLRETAKVEPDALGRQLAEDGGAIPTDPQAVEARLFTLERDRDAIGAVNLRAAEEGTEHGDRLNTMREERADLVGAISRLREGIETLNAEGRERLLAAFEVINGHFKDLFQTLFGGGQAELKLIESDDPLEAGLEIYACPPGKRLSTMSLMSGGEQALTAAALIFGVFLANPAPICVLDEVDAPLDDANVDRFCTMLDEMRKKTQTRFIAITHNPVTMARVDRLFGVTMPERGVSQLVSVDLRQAEAMVAQ